MKSCQSCGHELLTTEKECPACDANQEDLEIELRADGMVHSMADAAENFIQEKTDGRKWNGIKKRRSHRKSQDRL
jgi:uncharacterized OB-fold protein